MAARQALSLPKKPITPYIRHIPASPKVKNMTISVDMKFKDGIVLAVDEDFRRALEQIL